MLEYTLPTGLSKPIVVSTDPLYDIQSRDIDRLEIYESRSPEILGVKSFLVVAHPSTSWESETKETRESYPYDTIAWLQDGRPTVITFNVNSYAQGAYWLALFACEDEALEFANQMGHPASVIRQSDDEYQAEVARTNARNAEMLEVIRSNPQQFSSLPPSVVERLVTDGIPAFPVSLDEYYGPGHELPRCEK